jgi:hypothetical protein
MLSTSLTVALTAVLSVAINVAVLWDSWREARKRLALQSPASRRA